MSDFSGQWDREGVRELYRSRDIVKDFLDELAPRTRNPNDNTTTAEYLETRFGVDRSSAIETLRALATCKCGEFYVGRRGAPTRLQWSASAIEVAKDAQKGIDTTDNEPTDDSGVRMIEQVVWLRPGANGPDRKAFFRFPADLTVSEAKKMAGFAENMWVNKDIV